MSFMEFWIREDRLWRLRSSGKVTEHLIILPEQGIHEANQAPDHMTNGLSLAFVGMKRLLREAGKVKNGTHTELELDTYQAQKSTSLPGVRAS
jgi:hypothetical protein